MRRRDHEAAVAAKDQEIAHLRAIIAEERASNALLLDRLMASDLINFKGAQAMSAMQPDEPEEERDDWGSDPTGMIQGALEPTE